MMDELEFPDYGGEVAPVARPDWCGYCEGWDQFGAARSVLGTELGLVMEDCDGVQIEVVA